MKIRKVLSTLGIIMVCCIGLTACQSDGSDTPDSQEQPGISAETEGSDSTPVAIQDADPSNNRQVIQQACDFLYNNVTSPTYGTVGGEWTIFDLSRTGYQMEDAYVASYIKTVEDALTSTDGVLSDRKYTEYSRPVIALTLLGEDVTDVAGYDLIDYLTDFNNVSKQGFNGSAWALIAMDTVGYEFSTDVTYEVNSTRELLIQDIMDNVIATGGWGFVEDEADLDMTAMAITALAPYAEDEAIAAAIEGGIQYMGQTQSSDGTYEAYGISTAETCAQVVMALSTVGIDADKDERFIKNGTSLYDALLSYQLEDGSFCHIKGDGTDYLATEQTCYTLIAYDRFLNGQTDLFDFSDIAEE